MDGVFAALLINFQKNMTFFKLQSLQYDG